MNMPYSPIGPDLYLRFTNDALKLEKTVFVNYVHRAGCGVPYIEILVSQKRRNVLFRHRAGYEVLISYPAGIGRDWIWN